MSLPNSKRRAWEWLNFLILLDKAGWRVVKKPELTDKGMPRKPGPPGTHVG